MADLRKLLAERASVWEEMKSTLDTPEREGRDITAEERQKYDAQEKELESLSADIERQQKHDERAKELATFDEPADKDDKRKADPQEEYREAFTKFLVGGMEALESDQRKVLRSGWRADNESRAQSVGTTTAGGYLVPEGFRAQIQESLKAFGAVRNVAQVIQTSTGAALPWPTNNDTANVGALLAENTQDSEQDLTLGVKQLDAYKYTSKIVRVSLEFLQDVDWLDAESFLARKFAERLGRITNQHFTTGTGTAQPDGIVTSAVNGKTAAGVAAITLDELIDLQHSVDPAYRNSDRVRWMTSDTALASVRKLKDTTNQYLWQPSIQVGVADTLLGKPIEINPDMAVPATGVKSVLFGDFYAGYVIREVKDIQMIRMNERYADFFQVGFVSFLRTDGTAQDTGAYKALTQA